MTGARARIVGRLHRCADQLVEDPLIRVIRA